MKIEFLNGGEEPKIQQQSEPEQALEGQSQTQQSQGLSGELNLPNGEHYVPPDEYSTLLHPQTDLFDGYHPFWTHCPYSTAIEKILRRRQREKPGEDADASLS